MQIERRGTTQDDRQHPFCALHCDACAGMCLALYMMLTPNERDAMRERPRGLLH